MCFSELYGFVGCLCFFFQAEDGIRDELVTGVQTCALPIYSGIRDLPEGDHRRLYFEEIQKAAERAANLTQQLLAFSRRQIIEPKIVDLNRLVVDTSTMIRSVIGEGIELVTLLEPDLYNVKVDSGQMARVLINLAPTLGTLCPRAASSPWRPTK